jgi:hypothetical protein
MPVIGSVPSSGLELKILPPGSSRREGILKLHEAPKIDFFFLSHPPLRGGREPKEEKWL